eukprot:2756095-Prymnesium_polylepis.1
MGCLGGVRVAHELIRGTGHGNESTASLRLDTPVEGFAYMYLADGVEVPSLPGRGMAGRNETVTCSSNWQVGLGGSNRQVGLGGT